MKINDLQIKLAPKTTEQLQKEAEERLKRCQEAEQEVRNELRFIEAQKNSEKLAEYRELAILAHDVFCKYNHTDGCSWSYECSNGEHDWTESGTYNYSSHGRWLRKIEEIFEKNKATRYRTELTKETLAEIVQAFGELRAKHADAVWFLQLLMQ